MQTKAAELAGILKGKTIFYVRIETPNSQEAINEITLERQQGITCRVKAHRISPNFPSTSSSPSPR